MKNTTEMKSNIMNDETVIKDYISIDRDVKVLQPDWANPPTVKDLKQDLSEALPSHNLHVAKVNECIIALRGELKIKTAEGRSKVQPKVIRKQAEWRYASLEEPFLSTEDMFKVNPVTYKDVDAAKQNTMILNKQFRVDVPKVEFINKYIRAAVNTGTVIVKLSWESETDAVLDEVPVYTSTPEELYQVLQQMVASGQMTEEEAIPVMQAGEPIEIGVESKLVEKEIINRPVLEVKDSRNVIIDPSCEGDIRKAQFIIDKFLTDLSALKKDGRYSNLDKIQERDYDAPDMTYYDEWKDDPNFRFQDKPRKKLMAYEYWGYWDINNDGIVKPFVATWVGDVMIRLEENPYPDKQLPYVLVQYLPPDGNTLYGDADASLLKDNQDIIGAVSRSMIDLIGRSANAQQGVRKDLLDPINADRFKKGLDFEYNPVSNVGDALFTTKIPEIPRSALEMIQLQNNEAEAITGVKAFSGGITSQALGDSVGGIRSALDATAKRELGILRRLSNGLKKIGMKIISMNQVWLSDEEILRITDEDFIAIKRSDLAGNFDLTLDVSTAEADNQKASELAFMLQTIGQSVPYDITKLILSKIADLRKLPDLARAISEFVPQPDPMVVQQQQLQMELLKAQIQNEYAKAEENTVDRELKAARAQNELAKAGKVSSEKDKLDLDFVEQASGLKQERELESQLMGLQFKDRISKQSKEM